MPNFGPGGSMAAGGRSVRSPGVSLIGDFTGVGPLLGGAGKVKPPGYYNFTGLNLAKYNAALVARAAGTRNVKEAYIGDSTTAGQSIPNTGAIAFSWPYVLAGLRSNTSIASMWASHAETSAFDARIAITSGWSTAGSDSSAGGPMWNAQATGRLSFTPANQVDTFIFYYPRTAGLGSLNASIDSGSTTLINENGASAMIAQTFTTTLGNHTFNLDWVSGTAYAAHIVAYNSAIKEISVYNMGWAGATTSSWRSSGNPWNAGAFIPTVQADLNIIDLTINDANAGTPLPTYSSQLTTLGNAVLVNGSVIYISGNPSNPATRASLATQATYVAAMKAVALSIGVPFIDVWGTLCQGSYAYTVSQGWAAGDDVHFTAAGYAAIAAFVQPALVPGFVSN